MPSYNNFKVGIGVVFDTSNAQLQEELSKYAKNLKVDATVGIDYTKAQTQAKETASKIQTILQTAYKDATGIDLSKKDAKRFTTKYLREYTKQLEIATSQLTNFATEQRRLTMANTMERWIQNNTKATKSFGTEIDNMIVKLRSADDLTVSDLENIRVKFQKMQIAARESGKLGFTFMDKMTNAWSKFGVWGLSASSLTMVVSKFKEAGTELKNIDTILTEISKTNETLSKQELISLGTDSFDKASKYGRNASDYLLGVQEMSRSGYSDSDGLAELSTAAQSAGDMTAELANQYIIATDKAYAMNGSVQTLTATLDGANNITNNNAVNMTELAEGMSVVGSQAASSQMKVEQITSVIGTLIATTKQGGSEMGNAFKGILMNLRQVTGEVEDGGDAIDESSLTKYEKACERLGVSLSTVRNGVVSLKEPMQILKELSVEYNKLDESDAKRANLLSAVGGKYRANALNAILTNYDMYEKMLQDYAAGEGSMLKEAEKSANNWEGTLNKVNNTISEIADNFVKADVIIAGLNGFNSLLSVIEKITSSAVGLSSLGVGAGIFAFVKNLDCRKVLNFA